MTTGKMCTVMSGKEGDEGTIRVSIDKSKGREDERWCLRSASKAGHEKEKVGSRSPRSFSLFYQIFGAPKSRKRPARERHESTGNPLST